MSYISIESSRVAILAADAIVGMELVRNSKLKKMAEEKVRSWSRQVQVYMSNLGQGW